MYMHESNAIRFLIVAQRSSRCPYTLLLIELPTPVDIGIFIFFLENVYTIIESILEHDKLSAFPIDWFAVVIA
jgi:hypothetical protein